MGSHRKVGAYDPCAGGGIEKLRYSLSTTTDGPHLPLDYSKVIA